MLRTPPKLSNPTKEKRKISNKFNKDDESEGYDYLIRNLNNANQVFNFNINKIDCPNIKNSN